VLSVPGFGFRVSGFGSSILGVGIERRGAKGLGGPLVAVVPEKPVAVEREVRQRLRARARVEPRPVQTKGPMVKNRSL
jgi:hypothetical protein